MLYSLKDILLKFMLNGVLTIINMYKEILLLPGFHQKVVLHVYSQSSFGLPIIIQ